MTEPTTPDLSTFLWTVVTDNSPATLILIVLAMATWLVGGNLLVAKHYRRMGKSSWSGFKPFAFPFKAFNAKEWGILVLLAVMALTLFGLAMLANRF